MMNAKKSNINTTWKYLFIAPILILFMCILNEPIASARPSAIAVAKKAGAGNALHAFKALENEGNWFATIKGNTVNIRFQQESAKNENDGNNTTFQLAEFNNLPRENDGAFELVREAGTMHFQGKFTGNMGMGTYKFSPDKSYTANLTKEGIKLDDDDDVLVFFMIDIKKSYVGMLKRQGFSNVTKDDLIPLAALKVDESFIRSIKSSGLTEVSLQNLIPLKALGVDQAYIADIRKSGYKDLSVDQIISLKAQGIDGKFLKSSMEAAKVSRVNSNTVESPEQEEQTERVERPEKPAINENINHKKSANKDQRSSWENIIAMKVLNVDADYRNSFKQVGFNVPDEELIAMKSLGVTADFVKNIKAAGFTKITSDEVISMKALGLTPEEIKAYQSLGFKDITVDDVIAAKATGVTPAYISSMKKQGYNFGHVDKYVETKTATAGNK